MEEDNFNSMLKKSNEYKKIREDREKQLSKERLYSVSKTKIRTTMIGALDSIEKHFGFLWEDNIELKKTFEELRSDILDRGNNQIRNLGTEFESYTIVWNKNSIVLPFKKKEEDND